MQEYGHMTPAQRAWQDKWEREQEAYSRDVNNAFAFWRDCKEPRCQREHGLQRESARLLFPRLGAHS